MRRCMPPLQPPHPPPSKNKQQRAAYRTLDSMSSKLANKASHPSGRKAMQAVRASHKEERMKLHKIGSFVARACRRCSACGSPKHAGAQLMLKPWHVKSLWFKAALQDVLLEGQKSLTVVQWQQMCSMFISRNDDSIERGDVAAKVRRDEERRSLAEGAPTLPLRATGLTCDV
jgi:hypothetical protein